MKQSVGVPTASSMKSSFTDYGVGFLGGLAYAGSRMFLGNNFLASLAAPVIAGSIVKGTRGTVIATVAGFEAGQVFLAGGGLGGLFGSGASANQQEVM